VDVLLKVEHLDAGYGKHQVLFDLCLEIAAGDLTVVVGPNGSGKSTLLKSVFGLTTILGGKISYQGETISGMRAHDVARRGIAYLPQVDNVFLSLSAKENLMMAGYTVDSVDVDHRINEIVEIFPVLRDTGDRKAANLSGGERQMLAMAMALVREPRVMMFDEPTGNLAPKFALEVLKKIQDLGETFHITRVLVEQNVRKALEIGDVACLLVSGKLAFRGRPEELLERSDLNRLYLGLHV
jgi:branched-chain amino acid transport system ATP-binding protein